MTAALRTAPAPVASFAATLPEELRPWGRLREVVGQLSPSRVGVGFAGVAVIPDEATDFGAFTLCRRPTLVSLVVHPMRGKFAVLASFGRPGLRYGMPWVKPDRFIDLRMRPYSASRDDVRHVAELRRDPYKRALVARGMGGERAWNLGMVADYGRNPNDAKVAVSLWESVTSAAVAAGVYPRRFREEFPCVAYGPSGSTPGRPAPDAARSAPVAYARCTLGLAEFWQAAVERAASVPRFLTGPFARAFARGLPVEASGFGRLSYDVDGRGCSVDYADGPACHYNVQPRLLNGSPVKPGDVLGFEWLPRSHNLRGASHKVVMREAEAWAGGRGPLAAAVEAWVGRQFLRLDGREYGPAELLAGVAGAADASDVYYDLRHADPELFDDETGAYRLPPLPYDGEPEVRLGSVTIDVAPPWGW